jgi:DNA polymerase I
VSELFYYLTDDPNSPDTIDKVERYKHHFIDNRQSMVTVDTETVSVDDRDPIGIGIGVNTHEAFYFPCHNEPNLMIPWQRLKDTTVTKTFHNGIFDLDVIDVMAQNHGQGDFDTSNILDTMLMAKMLLEPVAVLSDLAWGVGKQTTPAKMLLDKFHVKTFDKVPEAEAALHCCQDVLVTYALCEKYYPQIDKEYFSVEMQIIDMLFRMSKRGIRIDRKMRDRLEVAYTDEMEYFMGICEGMGFNPGSPEQVGYIIAKRGTMLPWKRRKWGSTAKRALDTSEEVLQFVDDPIAAIVLRYRELKHHLSHNLIPLRGCDRAYTYFHLDAVTSRISSKGMKAMPGTLNLQNVPAAGNYQHILNPSEIRNIYIPDPTGDEIDLFTDWDYSQIELRILAALSKDPEMTRVYKDNLDIHQNTADLLHKPRKRCKNVNFGMIYGATAKTLQETAKIRDIRECQSLIDGWFKVYKGAADWIKQVQRNGIHRGYITTIFGRNIRLPVEMDSEDGLERKAVNYTIQASAAEIMKRGMLMCRDFDYRLQVHDELIINGKADLPVEALSHIVDFETPVSVKELERWE